MQTVHRSRPWWARLALVLGASLGVAATSHAQAQDGARAYSIGDFANATAALQATAGDRAFFQGAAKAADLDWQAARTELQKAVDDSTTTPQVRLRALRALLSVLLASGDYAAAARHAQLHHDQLEPDVRDGAGLFARVLAREPMPRSRIRSAVQPVRRDLAGLYRTTLMIEGRSVDTILDTGANFSVVRHSLARAAGLRLLEPAIKVADSAGAVAEGYLAIGRVDLAGSAFENVVFIVLPDRSLDFPGGYRIDAILGFPQLSQFGALAFTPERLVLSASSGPRVLDRRNLRFKDFKLFVDAEIEGVPLTLFLDTGARRSGLSNLAAPRLPQSRLTGAVKSQDLTGTGGTTTAQVIEMNQVVIDIGGSSVRLPRLPVRVGGEMDDRLGVIGQDVLSASGGYVLDFQRMRLELRDSAAAKRTPTAKRR